MLLAIDSGNTNTVFAVFEEFSEKVLCEWRSSTDTNRTADEYGVWLTQLMHLEGIARTHIKSTIVATVVPATLFSLKTLSRKYFHCDPMIVGDPEVELGVKVLLDNPEEVGADRLVNAVSAHERYGGPLIVVDFGTATTFDVVDGNGDYMGGAIAPGINLSLEALHMAAARLPRVAIHRPESVIGRETVGAMQSGIFWGYVSMIEGMVARIKTELGQPMQVVATGGLADLFNEYTDHIDQADSELTLRGLQIIFKRNRN